MQGVIADAESRIAGDIDCSYRTGGWVEKNCSRRIRRRCRCSRTDRYRHPPGQVFGFDEGAALAGMIMAEPGLSQQLAPTSQSLSLVQRLSVLARIAEAKGFPVKAMWGPTRRSQPIGAVGNSYFAQFEKQATVLSPPTGWPGLSTMTKPKGLPVVRVERLSLNAVGNIRLARRYVAIGVIAQILTVHGERVLLGQPLDIVASGRIVRQRPIGRQVEGIVRTATDRLDIQVHVDAIHRADVGRILQIVDLSSVRDRFERKSIRR